MTFIKTIKLTREIRMVLSLHLNNYCLNRTFPLVKEGIEQFKSCQSDLSNLPAFMLTAIKVRALHLAVTASNFLLIVEGTIDFCFLKTLPYLIPLADRLCYWIHGFHLKDQHDLKDRESLQAWHIFLIKTSLFALAMFPYSIIATEDFYQYWWSSAIERFRPLNIPNITYERGKCLHYHYVVN